MKAYYGFFETSDGAVAVACNARTLRLKMAACMGIEDRWTTESGWIPDDANAHERQVTQQVVALFKSQTSAPLDRTIQGKGIADRTSSAQRRDVRR